MKALRAFPYARRDISKDQEFEADNALDAHVLETVGHAAKRQSYQTRVMVADTREYIEDKTQPTLESMTADDLRALAARRGIKVHHRTGPEKLRQILKASA